MEAFLSKLAELNDALNTFIWVKIGLVLLLGTGVLMSVATNFFQITHLRHWWSKTFMGLFRADSHDKSDKRYIS